MTLLFPYTGKKTNIMMWTIKCVTDLRSGGKYFLAVLLFFSSWKMSAQMEQKNIYKLAMVQMQVDAGQPEQNLRRATQRIRSAAQAGASLALLPEAMDLGWTDPAAKTKAEHIPAGRVCQTLMQAAKENQIYVCAGVIEKDGAATYNSAIIINPAGEVILKHRKLNELDIAHDLYAQGSGLNVVPTPLGTFGLYICADATAAGNNLSHALGYMGADVILSPCAWAVPPDFDQQKTPYGETWRRPYADVSKRFDLYVVGVSNVGKINAGPWQDWDCIGNSLAYAPGGKEIIQAPFGVRADTIIYVDISLKTRPARGTGWSQWWKKEQ